MKERKRKISWAETVWGKKKLTVLEKILAWAFLILALGFIIYEALYNPPY